MIEIMWLCQGNVEFEKEFLNRISEFYNIIIKNGKIYIDTTTKKVLI